MESTTSIKFPKTTTASLAVEASEEKHSNQWVMPESVPEAKQEAPHVAEVLVKAQGCPQ